MCRLACLAVIVSVVLLPSLCSASETEESRIRELYSLMYKYMIAKDALHLGELLDDSFVLIHMTGIRQNKNEYLRAIKDGTLNYFSEHTENVEIRQEDGKAFLLGQSKVNAAVFGGGRYTWPLELDIDLIKRDDKWLMIEAHASTYK